MFNTIKDLFAPKPKLYALPSENAAPAPMPVTCPQQQSCLTRWFAPKPIDYTVPPPPVRPPIAPLSSAAVQRAVPAVATSDVTLRAYTHNPAFEPKHHAKQHEHDQHALSRDAEPVTFVVPVGCNAVDLLYGPIEVNPGVGDDKDLDAAVSIGKAKLQASTCDLLRLREGDELAVVVPWRGSSRLDLDANHLRAEVIAHFYQAEV